MGVTNLIIDAKLKQNSELFVHGVQLGISPPREVFRETHVFDYHGQGEQTQSVLCTGDPSINEWVHQLPTIEGQNALLPTAALEGGYSHKGWVTPLRWHQDTRAQTTRTNIKQPVTTYSDKPVTL